MEIPSTLTLDHKYKPGSRKKSVRLSVAAEAMPGWLPRQHGTCVQECVACVRQFITASISSLVFGFRIVCNTSGKDMLLSVYKTVYDYGNRPK